MGQATWRCHCGTVEAAVPTSGVRLVCYCASCRGFVERLGKADRLDAAGGNDLLQVAPDQVRFVKGTDHLAWLQITPKGPLRWYATCCGTPMANTVGTRQVPFASFQVADMSPAEHLPEVRARVHTKGAVGPIDGATGGLWPVLIGLAGRVIKARLTGKWRINPFFGQDGRPIAARRSPEETPG